MLAADKNNITLSGPNMEQERPMSPNVSPTFNIMLLKCRPTHQCCLKIADADTQQTQTRIAQGSIFLTQWRTSSVALTGVLTSVTHSLPGPLFRKKFKPLITSPLP
jgi:hypothetical protein